MEKVSDTEVEHRRGLGNISPDLSSKKGSKTKRRDWSITAWVEPTFVEDQMKFLIYGEETCPNTNKNHFQTYVYFHNPKTWDQTLKYFPSGDNRIAISKGDFKENLAYCSKEKWEGIGEVKEFGERLQQGKRNDLNKIAKEIISGTKVEDIVKEDYNIYHQYSRTLNYIEDCVNKKKFRSEMPDVIWYYGPTGVGKSHICYENYHPDTHYDLEWDDSGFWENYEGQKTVLINEFRGEIPFKTLLKICDKWPYSCKRKGRSKFPLLANKIIITSCKPPEAIYKNSLDDDDNIKQFLRRCKVYHIPMRGIINEIKYDI